MKWVIVLTFAVVGYGKCYGQATELTIVVENNQIELGKVAVTRLIAINSEFNINEIDLAPLYENFSIDSYEEIVTEEIASKYPEDEIQILALELYPRRTGKLDLPILSLGDVKTQATSIVVTDAFEKNIPMLIDYHVTTSEVWQRQQVIITIDIKSSQRFFSMEKESLKLPGFELLELEAQRYPINDDSPYRTHIQLGWVVFPLLSGEFSIDLPMIAFSSGGQIERRFHMPHIELLVKELPTYIPPNMPVTKVSVTSALTSSGPLQTGNLSYWELTISANGTLSYWLPPVLNEIKTNKDIEFLSAKSTRSLQLGTNGALASVSYHIPFKPLNSGRLDLPKLKLQYFNPGSGRIDSVIYQAPKITAWSITTITLIILLVAIPLALFLKYFYTKSRQKYYCYKRRKLALRIIQAAKTAGEIKIGLQEYAIAESWPANMTLSQFFCRWQSRYELPTELTLLSKKLSAAIYGAKTETLLDELKRGLMLQISRRRLKVLS